MAFSSEVNSLSNDWEKYLNIDLVFILLAFIFGFTDLISDGLKRSVMRISGFTILKTSTVYSASLRALWKSEAIFIFSISTAVFKPIAFPGS